MPGRIRGSLRLAAGRASCCPETSRSRSASGSFSSGRRLPRYFRYRGLSPSIGIRVRVPARLLKPFPWVAQASGA